MDRGELPEVPPIVSEDPGMNGGPLSPPVPPDTRDADPTPLDEALVAARESGERVEVPSLRTETNTVYANPSGAVTEAVASGPVRVETEEGWVPVDPTLEETAGGIAPVAVPGDIVLSAGGSAPLLSVGDPVPAEEGRGAMIPAPDAAEDLDRQRVTMEAPAGGLPAPELEGPTATYRGALDGADLVVTTSTVGAEVSVVIPDAASARESYELDLGVEGLSVAQDENGGLVFTDSEGNETGSQSAPVMFDATPSEIPGLAARPGRVSSELVTDGGQSSLVITPDAGYLADPETQFPVTIDPSTNLTPSGDTSVYESTPTQSWASSTGLVSGYTGYTARARTFIKFNPTTVIEDQLVTQADLKVYQNWAGSCTATPLRVQQASTLQANATWNTQPSLVGSTVTSVNTTGNNNCPSDIGWKTLNITSLGQTWADDAATTGTVALLADETDSTQAKGFASSETTNPPTLELTYLIYPDTPTGLGTNSTNPITTLRPTLHGTVSAPNYSGNILTKFRVFDDTFAQVAAYDVQAANGSTPEWSVPEDVLRPGRSYLWAVTACTGFFPQACSDPAWSGFQVNPALVTGQRSFFTYDTTGISDRSGISVNVASGNLSVTTSDLSMEGVNTPLSLTRTYNSLGQENRMFGHRWSGSFTDTVRLEPEPDGGFVYYGPTGEAVRIAYDSANGTYKPSGDLDARFADGQGYGVYVLEFNHDRGGFSAGDRLIFFNDQYNGGGSPLENRLWWMENRNGQKISLTYSGTTVTQVVDTQSRAITYTTSSGRVTSRGYGGRNVSYTYDGNGDLKTVTDADGKVTTYTYSGHLLTKITSPGNRVIDIVYDTRGRATSIKRTVSGVVEESTFAYDDTVANGRFRTDVTDAKTNVTKYYADYAARVEQVLNAQNHTVETEFDDNSNVKTITDAASQNYTYGWSQDGRNNLESVEMPTGAEATSSFNQSATTGLTPYQPTSSTDAQGNGLAYTFDSVGNMQQTVNDLTSQNSSRVERHGIGGISCAPAKKGQVCKAFNARNIATTFTYNSDGNLIVVTTPSPLGNLTMAYDTFSRVTTVNDGKGNNRVFTYDPIDRLDTATYAGGIVIDYDYDAYGNVTDRDDDGTAWSMSYNEANRLGSIDGPTQSSPYPADMHDVDFTYDKVGNVTSVVDVGGTTYYGYDNLNNTTVIVDPDGNWNIYNYDDSLQDNWLTSIDYSNGTTTELGYDASGRVVDVTNRSGGGTVLDDLGYTFTDGSNDTTLRQTVTTTGSSTAYDYDALNRLTSAITTLNGGGTSASYGYTYDGAGNRTQAVANGSTTNFTYNNADELTTSGVVHDANGNMTSGGAHGYTSATYNPLDQATSITPKYSSARTQTYAGQLQSVWLSDAATRFTTAASLGITATATTTAITTFTRDPQGRLVSFKQGGNRYHYLYDGRGSIIGPHRRQRQPGPQLRLPTIRPPRHHRRHRRPTLPLERRIRPQRLRLQDRRPLVRRQPRPLDPTRPHQRRPQRLRLRRQRPHQQRRPKWIGLPRH